MMLKEAKHILEDNGYIIKEAITENSLYNAIIKTLKTKYEMSPSEAKMYAEDIMPFKIATLAKNSTDEAYRLCKKYFGW